MRTRTVGSAEELKALAHSIRWAIIHIVMAYPDDWFTASELATSINVSKTNIYYHLLILYSAGYLHVRVFDVINGIEEKEYQAAQDRIEFHLGRSEEADNSRGQSAHTGTTSSRLRRP